MVDLEKLIGLLTTGKKRKEDLSHEERDAIIDSRHDPDTPPSFELQRIEWKRQVTSEESSPVESARIMSASGTAVTLLKINAAFVDTGFRFSKEQRRKSRVSRTRDELSILIERTVEKLTIEGHDIKTMSVVKRLGDFDEKNILRAYGNTDMYGTLLDPKKFKHYFSEGRVHWVNDDKTAQTTLHQMRERIKTARKHLKTRKTIG